MPNFRSPLWAKVKRGEVTGPFGDPVVLKQSPLFFDSVRPRRGQREGPVLICGEAEQGLPGTVGWGRWAHKGLVDGDWWGRAMSRRGRAAPECAVSSHGVRAAMSWLGNKQRRTHEEQK